MCICVIYNACTEYIHRYVITCTYTYTRNHTRKRTRIMSTHLTEHLLCPKCWTKPKGRQTDKKVPALKGEKQ